MKKTQNLSKKSKEKSNEIDDEIEYQEIDINPIIFDYMVKKTFNMFDEDGSGDIDKGEFAKLTDALGLQINERRKQELLRELDKEGSGTIDYDEFLNLMEKFQMGDTKKQMEETFTDYDKDMDNIITLNDILKVSEELDGVQLNEDDAKLIIAFFKYFANDKATKIFGITKDEFLLTLNKLNFVVEKDENSDALQDFINRSRNSMNEDINKSAYGKSTLKNPNSSKVSKSSERKRK